MLLKNDVRTLSLSQAPAVIQLLLASLLAHRLSEIDYGTFNYLKNIAIMGYAFVSFSFERTALNLQASYSLKTITCNIIPIRMIMFFLLAIPIVIYTLVSGVLPILVALTAASLIPAIFDIKYSFDIKQTVHKDIYLALFRAAPLLLLIPLLLFSTSGTTILTAHFALLLSGYSLYVFLQHGHVPGLIGKLELKNSKLFFQLSAFVFLGSIASNLNIYVSTLIIEARIGLSELATYSVALTIYLGLLSVFSLIVRISVSQYLGNDQFKREFFTCMKKIMPIWFVFSLAIIMYGKTLIEFVFGTNYSQSY
ncbi:MAG: hypothetical protein KJN90_03715, partial [Gammaproteobacteria bacterium]|nr:hypothetical protein [Gammaproteobacteria bacterium]